MERLKRLKQWTETLTEEQAKEILTNCVDILVDFEYVSFYEFSKAPYWDGSGERLDGIEEEE